MLLQGKTLLGGDSSIPSISINQFIKTECGCCIYCSDRVLDCGLYAVCKSWIWSGNVVWGKACSLTGPPHTHTLTYTHPLSHTLVHSHSLTHKNVHRCLQMYPGFIWEYTTVYIRVIWKSTSFYAVYNFVQHAMYKHFNRSHFQKQRQWAHLQPGWTISWTYCLKL